MTCNCADESECPYPSTEREEKCGPTLSNWINGPDGDHIMPSIFMPSWRYEWTCSGGCVRSQVLHCFENGIGLSVLHLDVTQNNTIEKPCAFGCRGGYEISVVYEDRSPTMTLGQYQDLLSRNVPYPPRWWGWGSSGEVLQGLSEADVAAFINNVSKVPKGGHVTLTLDPNIKGIQRLD